MLPRAGRRWRLDYFVRRPRGQTRHADRKSGPGAVLTSAAARPPARGRRAARRADALARPATRHLPDARRVRETLAPHRAAFGRFSCARRAAVGPARPAPGPRIDRVRGARRRSASAPGLLEATFDPGCRLGEWDFQMLGLAAHLAALVLEIERLRVQLARAGLLPVNRPRRDGAAPLIGSTPAHADALRSTIERVAATDFTVLLEGESGVGKELVARQIHELSRRRTGRSSRSTARRSSRRCSRRSCLASRSAPPPASAAGAESSKHADGGTLFLDEVSDLSLVGAGQAAAGDPGPGGRTGGRQRHPSRRHPHRRGDQPQSVATWSSGSCSGRTCSTA